MKLVSLKKEVHVPGLLHRPGNGQIINVKPHPLGTPVARQIVARRSTAERVNTATPVNFMAAGYAAGRRAQAK